MIPSLVVMAGLVMQVSATPVAARASRVPDPVRVQRADSTLYVTLREPGHLLLLYVDPIGRIRVLFPESPDAGTAASNGAPIALPLPPEAQGNPATFLAVRTRWPFDFGVLRAGRAWDYQNAWLLQPTGGDPLAAVLDIADRVTDGRPYDFGVVSYARGGTVATRRTPRQPDVCLGCVRRGVPAPAAAVATNAVDCSNASLTNSFCGVNSGSVSIASAPAPQVIVYQAPPAPAPAPTYVPYFVPMSHGFGRRFEPSLPPAPVAPRSQGAAYPIAPRLVVPSAAALRPYTGRH